MVCFDIRGADVRPLFETTPWERADSVKSSRCPVANRFLRRLRLLIAVDSARQAN